MTNWLPMLALLGFLCTVGGVIALLGALGLEGTLHGDATPQFGGHSPSHIVSPASPTAGS